MTRNLREIGLSATTPSGDEPARVQRTGRLADLRHNTSHRPAVRIFDLIPARRDRDSHGHFGQAIRMSGPAFAPSKLAIHRPARTSRDPWAWRRCRPHEGFADCPPPPLGSRRVEPGAGQSSAEGRHDGKGLAGSEGPHCRHHQ